MTQGINLLPEHIRKSTARMRVVRAWSIVFFFGCIAVGIVVQYRWTAITRVSTDLVQIKPEADEILLQLEHVKALEAQLARLENELQGFDAAPRTNGILPLLNTVARGVDRYAASMVLTQIEFIEEPIKATEATPVSLGKTSTQSEPLAEVRLMIHGNAESDITVGRFVQALRESSLFQNVTLRDEANPPAEGFLRRSFVIDCSRREVP
ncbi:MAG: hypothetical protein JNM43_14945 [Planctomycetaceae bacterium]|nr:hypothetical protein [Planctomycetaceae bacterium]